VLVALFTEAVLDLNMQDGGASIWTNVWETLAAQSVWGLLWSSWEYDLKNHVEAAGRSSCWFDCYCILSDITCHFCYVFCFLPFQYLSIQDVIGVKWLTYWALLSVFLFVHAAIIFFYLSFKESSFIFIYLVVISMASLLEHLVTYWLLFCKGHSVNVPFACVSVMIT
jgi:hypothetical protein